MLRGSGVSDSLQPHGLQPTRLLCPWDFPGKNTRAGCHFLLQGIFPTQGLNLGLLYCRWILYQVSHQCKCYVTIICKYVAAQANLNFLFRNFLKELKKIFFFVCSWLNLRIITCRYGRTTVFGDGGLWWVIMS